MTRSLEKAAPQRGSRLRPRSLDGTGLRALLASAAEAAIVIGAIAGVGLLWAAAESLTSRGAVYAPAMAPHDSDPNSASSEADPALPSVSLWLLDAYNVLHAGLIPGEERRNWWAAPARARLIERVESLRAGADEIVVVFDGSRPAAEDADPGTRVRLVFAESADDWILARVRNASDPGSIAVVTGDKPLAGRARHQGARIVSPRVFLESCA